MSETRRWWITGAVASITLFAVVLWGLAEALRRERVEVAPPGDDLPAGSRTVELRLPTREGGIAAERREILGGETLEGDVRRVVEELVRGGVTGLRPIPPATRLLGVFFDGEGRLILDFSDDLRTDHPGGSAAEAATLRCLVSTLAVNFASIDEVTLLVDGEPVPTLAGTSPDLDGPLDVERLPIAVRRTAEGGTA
jgi:hypothetical protein